MSGAEARLKTFVSVMFARSRRRWASAAFHPLSPHGQDFSVSREYYRVLLHRQELLSNEIPKRKAIHSTLITTFGLTYNEYSGVFNNTILLDDLFRR